MSKEDKELLEMFIDRWGIYNIVSTLASICADKAVHISENWQDYRLARVWSRYERVLESILFKL